MARDTKLGPEEITRDIPNVSEEALKNLDEAGIVYIGAEVQPGDILVGKITPKGESPMTPEEKLLRAIFGEKASDVRDTSHAHAARAPSARSSKCASSIATASRRTSAPWRSSARRSSVSPRTATTSRRSSTATSTAVCPTCCVGKEAIAGPKGFKKGTKLSNDDRSTSIRVRSGGSSPSRTRSCRANSKRCAASTTKSKKALEQRFMDKVEKVQRGDEMPPGVMKMVKVFVAVKRKMQPGDKMAGRHGNKGVVSRIVPVEDMPFLEDGTHVDIVLNPLGVPIAHECRPDPRNASGLGLRRHGQEDRRADRRLQGRAATSSRCARRSKT